MFYVLIYKPYIRGIRSLSNETSGTAFRRREVQSRGRGRKYYASLTALYWDVLCQLEFAQDSSANSSTLVKVLEHHEKSCLMFYPKHEKQTESLDYLSPQMTFETSLAFLLSQGSSKSFCKSCFQQLLSASTKYTEVT